METPRPLPKNPRQTPESPESMSPPSSVPSDSEGRHFPINENRFDRRSIDGRPQVSSEGTTEQEPLADQPLMSLDAFQDLKHNQSPPIRGFCFSQPKERSKPFHAVEESEKRRSGGTTNGCSQPQRAGKRHWTTRLSDLTIDALFITLSLGLLGFAVIAQLYDQTPVDQYPQLTAGLLTATKYGPTVFPILFAAVVGRATKHFIFWRLERGERLGLLDLLANSTTVINAIASQVTLRSFSLAGCAIALIWICSPLGGQAALRIVAVGVASSETEQRVSYLSMDSSYYGWYTANPGPKRDVTLGLYAASILESPLVRDSPNDAWGNAKIPMIEVLEATAKVDDSSWYDVPDHDVTYSALIGLPMLPIKNDVALYFVIQTSYLALSCPLISALPDFNFDDAFYRADSSHSSDWTNTSNIVSTLATHTSGVVNGSVGCDRSINGSLSARALGCIATSLRSDDMNRTQALCYVTTSYIDAQVRCTSGSCRTVKIRRSPNPHAPPSWTFLDRNVCSTWSYFAEKFIGSIRPGGSRTGTIVQGYLADPKNPSAQDSSVPFLWDVPSTTFATRFAQLLNTFWLASVGVLSVPNIKPSSTSAEFSDIFTTFSNTTGRSVKEFKVIQCHWAWFVVLTMTSLLLLFASIVPGITRLWMRAPALSFNVSDMLRDNPCFQHEPISSTLDSSDRARILKDIRVKYGDVAPEREVGHIAIGSVQGGSHAQIERARKDRLYD